MVDRQPPRATSDEIDLYIRTYYSLLRASGNVRVRAFEEAHLFSRSSLHLGAEAPEPDLAAFGYSAGRLPDCMPRVRRLVLGQSHQQFDHAGYAVDRWQVVRTRGRRRPLRWDGGETLAAFIASASDIDDLVPILTAYQIEWNKLRRKLRAIGWPRPQGLPGADECARVLGGSVDDWERLQEAWGTAFARRLGEVAETNLSLRVRMLGGSQASYARLTRRWWAPVANTMRDHGIGRDAPIYFVSSNTHSLVNLLSGDARARETDLVDWVQRAGPRDLQDELAAFREERTAGSWNNFLYFLAREQAISEPGPQTRRYAEAARGILHLNAESGLRVAAQVMPLSKLDPAAIDDRLGNVDAEALQASRAVLINIEDRRAHV